jgi:hypothetical protein
MCRYIVGFYGEDLLAPRPTTKLEDHFLSAFRDCLFIIFAGAFHIGDGCSNRNVRTRHSVVTGTHSLLWDTASFVKWVPTFPNNVISSKQRSVSSQKNRVLNTLTCFSLPCHRLCLGGSAALKGPIVYSPDDKKLKTKLRGLSPRANYTDGAAAAGRRS